MLAHDYLSQITMLVKQIKNVRAERALWRDMATATGAHWAEDVKIQSSAPTDRLAEAAIRISDFDSTLAKKVLFLQSKWDSIISTIELLPPAYYDILHMEYVQQKTLDEVADICQRSKRWANYTHKIAIEKLQAILDSREG